MLLQISVLYTCPPKIHFSISMWKTFWLSNYWRNLKTVGFFLFFYFLFVCLMFDLMYFCRCQLCIHFDLSYSFKSAYDKFTFSWNAYWDWIKGILRVKFLVELINFCRYQLFFSFYQPKVVVITNCTTSSKKDWTQVLYRFKSCLGCVRYSRW